MSTEFRSSVEKNAVKCIGIRIHHLETDSNLFATIRKCVARVLPNGLLLTFSFLFVLLAFGSIAQAFTQEDIHCPITAMSLSLLKFVGQASLVDDAMLPS